MKTVLEILQQGMLVQIGNICNGKKTDLAKGFPEWIVFESLLLLSLESSSKEIRVGTYNGAEGLVSWARTATLEVDAAKAKILKERFIAGNF